MFSAPKAKESRERLRCRMPLEWTFWRVVRSWMIIMQVDFMERGFLRSDIRFWRVWPTSSILIRFLELNYSRVLRS